MQIVFLGPITVADNVRRELLDLGAHLYVDMPTDYAELKRRIAPAEIVIGKRVDIDAALIEAAPDLRYIISPAVGYQQIDYKYAAQKSIPVSNCPAYNANAVAEHAIGLLLAVQRGVVTTAVALRIGTWESKPLIGAEIQGKRLGLIGYGNVGKLISNKASALGMKVSFLNSTSTEKEIEELLRTSDVVCLSLPLNDATFHFLDRRRLSYLAKHCLLINVGRGATIDQEALLKTLQAGDILGAGLDVFEDERREGAPSDEIVALANLPNVVATPHIGANTHESNERFGRVLLETIHACLRNKPINVVNGLT